MTKHHFSKPDFLCIGAQKAGTTWLHNALKMHNRVWLPGVKELHYFDGRHKSKNYKNKKLKELEKSINKIKLGQDVDYVRLECLSKLVLVKTVSDEVYLSIFQNQHAKAIGEITPAYSSLNESEVKHIYDLLGNIKIIFLLRDPTSRAWSQVRMIYKKKLNNKDGNDLSSKEWIELIESKINLIDMRTNYIKTSMLYEKYLALLD